LPMIQDVPTYTGYDNCGSDALRPPEAEERTFGGVSPADVNYRHLFDGMRLFGFPKLEELAVRFESRGGRVCMTPVDCFAWLLGVACAFGVAFVVRRLCLHQVRKM
jgi:hypothetical protein